MKVGTVTYYATQADARERDPIIIPGEHGRADVANGRMGPWLRFNRVEDLLWIDDADGRPVPVTRMQHRILILLRRLSDTRVRVTYRRLAQLLNVSPSTISRAVVRFVSFGLFAVQTNRGRNGGTIIVTRTSGDGLAYLRDEAKAKIRAWAKAQEARISRLRANVASYLHGGNGISLTPVPTTRYRTQHLVTKWSPDELREVGIL